MKKVNSIFIMVIMLLSMSFTAFAGDVPEGLLSGNDTLQPTNGLTTPFASLTSAKWQQFGNTKLFIKVRAN